MKIPEIFAVLNATPNSHSGDGINDDIDKAIAIVKDYLALGVEVIDIGGESTRTSLKPYDKNHSHIPKRDIVKLEGEKAEWQRLDKILQYVVPLIRKTKTKISIDTKNVSTARNVIKKYDIDIINDVSAFADEEMIDVIKNSQVDYLIMHNLGLPADPNNIVPEELDIVEVVYKFLKNKVDKLLNAGINKDRIIIDPGIQFGKRAEQSLILMKNAIKFKEIGCRILYGHSRKTLFNLFTDIAYSNRNIESIAASLYLATQSVDFVRVHDVKDNIRAFKVAEALF